MKIQTYLKKQKLSLSDFCLKHGLKYNSVYQTVNKHKYPSLPVAAKIKKATRGAVTFEDWLK